MFAVAKVMFDSECVSVKRRFPFFPARALYQNHAAIDQPFFFFVNRGVKSVSRFAKSSEEVEAGGISVLVCILGACIESDHQLIPSQRLASEESTYRVC